MPIPDYQALMLPVLQCCVQGETTVGELAARLAVQLNLTEEERSKLLPSGQATFTSRISWAKTYLSKAGLLERTKRGQFRLTSRGQTVLAQHPSSIDNKLLMQFEEFRKFRERSAPPAIVALEKSSAPIDEETQTPDEAMRAAWSKIESSLAQDLLERICAAPPEFFERLIVRLLLSMGYGGSVADAGRALGRSGDDGVDGVIDQDALGLDRVFIQAKRYKEGNNIGPGSIRDFFGSLDRHKAAKGLFVTTSTFSPSAKETAEHLSKRIVLIDGVQLAKLMIWHNVGCRIEETVYIKKIDEDFFE